jgi:F-type H+-transporting ATPase subunit b
MRKLSNNPSVLYLAVVVACVLSFGVWVHAQDQAEPAKSPDTPVTQNNADQQQGIGQQLAHETREAAGEDDTAAFKKSASVQWLARLTGGNVEHAYWLALILNFAVVFGVLYWAGKKYLPGAFRNRTASIQKAMEEARRASEDANRRLAEIELRLAKLGEEIKSLTATADREIVEEEARVRAAAEEEAQRIVEAAGQEIDAAAKAARRDLTSYAADLAVSLAKRQIHVDQNTDEALVRQFSSRIAGEGGKN